MTDTTERLEYLRSQIRAERISWGEIADLQGMADEIDRGDVELLEWAGVPEFPVSEYDEMPLQELMDAAHNAGLHQYQRFTQWLEDYYDPARSALIRLLEDSP